MTTQRITTIGYLIIGAAIFITVYLMTRLGANKMDAWNVFFFTWALFPYIVMGIILGWHSKKAHKWVVFDCLTIFIVTGSGLYLIVKATYLSANAQGGIAILIIPMLQLAAYVVLSISFMIFSGDNQGVQ